VLVDRTLHAIEVAMSVDEKSLASIAQAKEAALHILLHNARGPLGGDTRNLTRGT
jgi:hypothetical protein